MPLIESLGDEGGTTRIPLLLELESVKILSGCRWAGRPWYRMKGTTSISSPWPSTDTSSSSFLSSRWSLLLDSSWGSSPAWEPIKDPPSCSEKNHPPWQNAEKNSLLNIVLVETFNLKRENNIQFTSYNTNHSWGSWIPCPVPQNCGQNPMICSCKEESQSNSDCGTLCDNTDNLWNRIPLYNSDSNQIFTRKTYDPDWDGNSHFW